MSTNVYHLPSQPDAAAADPRESLAEAVREVSARLAFNNGERRGLYSRLDELRSADPRLRRSRPRTPHGDPQRPLTFYSIEDAAAGDAATPLQAA